MESDLEKIASTLDAWMREIFDNRVEDGWSSLVVDAMNTFVASAVNAASLTSGHRSISQALEQQPVLTRQLSDEGRRRSFAVSVKVKRLLYF